MANILTLLKDERLTPKVEEDMYIPKSNNDASYEIWKHVRLPGGCHRHHCAIAGSTYISQLTYTLQNYLALPSLLIETIYCGNKQEILAIKCRAINVTSLNLGFILRWLKGILPNGFWINSLQKIIIRFSPELFHGTCLLGKCSVK